MLIVNHSLHRLSGFLFYLLGTSFFVAYLLLKNAIVVEHANWWLQRMDLPLALVTILYGGTSLYRSLHHKKEPSRALALGIGIPLAVVFIFLVLLNFWEVLPFSQGETLL